MAENKRKKSSWALIGALLGAAAALMTLATGVVQLGFLGPAFKPEVASETAPKPAEAAVPASEQRAWQYALANRKDCDAIRRYVLDYPTGSQVTSAQAILAAQRPVDETLWEPFDFPSSVAASSSLDARTSRELACVSAQQQLTRNMNEGCRIFVEDAKRYRNVTVRSPSSPSCDCQDEAVYLSGPSSAEPIWRCTIRSTYGCTGQQAITAKSFTCE